MARPRFPVALHLSQVAQATFEIEEVIFMRKHINLLALLAALVIGGTATAQAADDCCTAGTKTCCTPGGTCCKK